MHTVPTIPGAVEIQQSSSRKEGFWYSLPLVAILLALLTVLLAPSLAYTLPNNLRFKRIGLEEGLSQVSMLCSAMDRQGFLWFGTYNGLNRYDGQGFKVYNKHVGDPGSISDNVIRALLVDNEGVLWVGTSNGGLNRYDVETDSFIVYANSPDDPTSLSNDEVRSLYEDEQGTLWVGTANGLNAMTNEGGFVRYAPAEGEAESHRNNSVLTIGKGPAGVLLVGTQEELVCFDPATGEWLDAAKCLKGFEALPDGPVYKLIYEPSAAGDGNDAGMLWLGIGEDGLFRVNLSTGEAKKFFPGAWVTSMFKDSRGILWAGTEEGLARRQGEDFLLYRKNPFDPSSLPHDDITSILEDNAGVLWVGTYGAGLAKMDPRVQEFQLLRNEAWNPHSIPGERVSAVKKDLQGFLWVGTAYSGLSRVDLHSDDIVTFMHDDDDPASFPAEEIRAMVLDREGALWIGTADAGVVRMDTESGTFVTFRNDPDDPESLSHNNVYTVYDDGKGSIWVGMSKGGLNRLDKATGKAVRYPPEPDNPKGLSHRRVRVMTEMDGYLWLGTNNGLDRLDVKTGVFKRWLHVDGAKEGLPDDLVTTLLPSEKPHTIWVGTNHGLASFDTRTEEFVRYTTERGYAFPSEAVTGLLRDNQGHLWVSSFKGLSRFDPRTGDIRNFTPADGLQGYEFLDNATFKDHDGTLFFGGVNGLTFFQPQNIDFNTHAPPVVLTSVKVMNKAMKFDQNVSQLESLTLSYKDVFFALSFAGLDFMNPERNTYAYKLEGFDKEWVNAGTSHTATYTNINPGEYEFKVRAANCDGVWSEEPTTLRLIITPPFWATLWFRTLLVLLVIMAAVLFYEFRTRSLKRQRRLLQQLVEERTQELASAYAQVEGLMFYSPSAIALKDDACRYTRVNPQFRRFFHEGDETASLGSDKDYFPPETAAKLELACRGVLQTGTPATFEMEHNARTFIIQLFALRTESGAPFSVCLIATDISERKQAEDDLRASQARYRGLAANFPEGFVGLFDADLRFSVADGAGLSELGMTPGSLMGKTVAEAFPKNISQRLEQPMRKALDGSNSAFDVRILGREFEIRMVPIADEDGQVLSGMIVAHNVTQRVEAEKARLESEQIYRRIAEISPDAIMVHDHCGILFANNAAAKILGVPGPEAIRGRSMLSLTPDEQVPALQDLFDQAWLRRGAAKLQEIQLVDAGGALVSVEMATVPITFMEGEALLTIGRDITEKKRLQAEAMRTAQLASLGELAAGVAHEINNPINGIINFAEIIRDDENKRLSYEELPERIIKEGERIATIVRTLLNFSRGQDEPPYYYRVEEALQDALRLCRNQMEKDGITLSVVEQDKDLLPVFGKPSELQQVFINLLSNARFAVNVKFDGVPDADKQVDITLKNVENETGKIVRIAITDNGSGIEPAVMQRLFEPFFSTKPRNEGTGLGLSISYKIIKDHGGKIWYESEPERFTKAIVDIPGAEYGHGK